MISKLIQNLMILYNCHHVTCNSIIIMHYILLNVINDHNAPTFITLKHECFVTLLLIYYTVLMMIIFYFSVSSKLKPVAVITSASLILSP